MRQPLTFIHSKPLPLVGMLLMLFFVIEVCQSEKPTPLRVGSIPSPGYETLFLARELGLYKETSIELKERSATAETLRAFRQNQFNITALTLDETVRPSQTEADLQIILVSHISERADRLIFGVKIHNISDLEGKIIDVLVAHKSLRTTHAKAIEALLSGYWQALTFLNQYPEQGYPLIAARLGLESDALEHVYAGLIQPDPAFHQHFFQQKLPSIIEQHSQFMLHHNTLLKPANTAKLLGRENE